MRSARTWGIGALVAAGLAGAIAWTGLPDSRTSTADEGALARLLVKCRRSDVGQVLEALAGQPVQVWDLDTMAHVRLPDGGPAPADAGPVPALPDATRTMQEMLLALDGVRTDDGGPALLVTEVAIQERRAVVGLRVGAMEILDRARRALAANGFLQGRVLERGLESGPVQASPTGWLRARLSLRFRDAEPAPSTEGALPGTVQLDRVQRAALVASMQLQFAGPEQDDPHRGRGHRTISREFTFAPATLPQLLKLLAAIPAEAPGPTVFEVRWKLEDPDKADPRAEVQRLQKCVVRVGARMPLGP